MSIGITVLPAGFARAAPAGIRTSAAAQRARSSRHPHQRRASIGRAIADDEPRASNAVTRGRRAPPDPAIDDDTNGNGFAVVTAFTDASASR
jgi:hypothetical protein